MADRLHWMPSTRSWLAKYKDDAGRHRSKRIPPEILDEDEAWKWFAQWLSTQQKGAGLPPVVATVPALSIDQLMQRWIAWLKAKPGNEGKKAPWKFADVVLRHWVRPFRLASIDANALQLHDCVDWIEDVHRKARAANTARNVIKVVRMMLSDARGKGWRVAENFFLDPYVRKRATKREGGQDEDVVALTLPQVRQMIAFQGTTVLPVRHARNVVSLATALRRGEVVGLRVRDVCINDVPPMVEVNRQVDTGESSRHDIRWKEPKRGSRRRVPLHPAVIPVLRRWLDAGWKNWTGRSPQPDDVLFPDPSGGPYVGNFAYQLRTDLAAYGLPIVNERGKPFTFHALRRTCLTLLADADVPDGDIKAVAGHAQQGVTRRHYIRKNLQRIARGVRRVKLAPPARRDAADEEETAPK